MKGLLSLFRRSKKKTEQRSQSAMAPPKAHKPAKPASDWVTVTVRDYDANRGRGFLRPGDGGQDIIVFAEILKSCNIETLTRGQTVDVKCRQAPKGPKAVELRLST